MYQISPEFLRAIRFVQRVVTTLEWRYGADGDWQQIPFQSGTVTCDRRSNTRWSTSLVLPAGAVPVSPLGFSSYGAQLRIQRGINIPRIGVQMVPWGIYRVENVKDNGPAGIMVEAYSREIQLIDARFFAPRRIGGDTATNVVQQLVNEVSPDVAFSWLVDGGPVVSSFIENQDRWGVLDGGISGTAIATWLNAEMFYDGRGVFTIAPIPTIGAGVDWDMQPDPDDPLGVVISPSKEYNRDGVYNIVSGLVQTSDGKPPIGPAFAWDSDPGSPTYAGVDPIGDPVGSAAVSKFGPKTIYYSTPLATTFAQLSKIVTSLLANVIGLSYNLSFTVASNPALLPGDVVNYGADRYIIDSWTADLLGPTMSCVTRSNKIVTGDVAVQS